MEGILDAIQNYTVNTHGRVVPIVLTEHGGYLFRDPGNFIPESLATTLLGPGDDFAWELRRRSVGHHIMVSGAIGNTLAFLNHPHTVRKAVPFMLLESSAWDPRYYASILVAQDFTDTSNWVESENIHFYRLFGSFRGERVVLHSASPDVQAHAVIEDSRVLHVAMNNLSDEPLPQQFGLTNVGIESIRVKRVGRNSDFTPYFVEEELGSLDGFVLGPREAVMLDITYVQALVTDGAVDETPYYGDRTSVDMQGTELFTVETPDLQEVAYATLRVGVGRPVDTDRDLLLVFNGRAIDVPLEASAGRLEDTTEYGSTKLISIDPELLQATNTVELSFADGRGGGVGAVVLRVAHHLTP